MRGKLLIFALGLTAVLAYAASPFVAAWSIREAIRTGDAAYLSEKVEWPRVKETLKVSLTAYALGPGYVAPGAAAGTLAAAPRPGLWQRIKNAYGRRVVTSMVDNMVTPESLPKLFSYRQSFNEKVRRLPDEATTLSLLERVRRNWSRVTRAEFLTPTRFAMEMRDKVIEHRSYLGHLELQGGTWRLVHLEIKGERPEGTASRAWAAARQAALP